MKPLIFLLPLLILLFSCTKEGNNLSLNPENDLCFSGTFKSENFGNISGNVLLTISKGYYECSTNYPYGRGAGQLILDGTSIEFRDTLFFIIPAMYGPSFVLSGKYDYQYDGEHLELRKSDSGIEMHYSLSRKD